MQPLFKTIPFSVNEEFADEMPMEMRRKLISLLAREILITMLPYKPLCQAACQGLCPTCGSDLNEKQCCCPVDNVDPRLSVLKKLLE